MKKIRALFFKLGADDHEAVTFDMLQEQFSSPAVREYFESLGPLAEGRKDGRVWGKKMKDPAEEEHIETHSSANMWIR